MLTVVMFPASAGAAFRAGDVGQSLPTPQGPLWVYGDSWNNGNFIRNAITLNGKYVGTINGVPKGHWVWPGAPWVLEDGRIAVYGSEMMQKGSGMWGFERVGSVYATFDPGHPAQAEVVRISDGSPWSAAVSRDEQGVLVYKVDADRHPMVGRPMEDGSVQTVATFKNAFISGQFSVLQDPWGEWWMVGSYIMLSKRVVAYHLASPKGPVIGKMRTLLTLPDQADGWNVYAATVHPELDGLLTYATNGKGPGGFYGLHRIENFWPQAIATSLGKSLPEDTGSSSSTDTPTEPSPPVEPPAETTPPVDPPVETTTPTEPPVDPPVETTTPTEPPAQTAPTEPPAETVPPAEAPEENSGNQLASITPLLILQTLPGEVCNNLHHILVSKVNCQKPKPAKATHKKLKKKKKKKHVRKHRRHRH